MLAERVGPVAGQLAVVKLVEVAAPELLDQLLEVGDLVEQPQLHRCGLAELVLVGAPRVAQVDGRRVGLALGRGELGLQLEDAPACIRPRLGVRLGGTGAGAVELLAERVNRAVGLVPLALLAVTGYDYPREGIWGARLLEAFPTSLGFVHGGSTTPTRQRGGIHTNAAVRALARQAWGDRDLRYRSPIDTVDAAAVRFALLELD